MNKETIIDRMQSYFSGENQNPEFDTSIEMDALQLFYVRTAKRLVIANELQKKDTIYRDDFFIALRDYLLVFETSLSLSNVIIPDDNPYAIKKDVPNGKYYATFQFPEGVTDNELQGGAVLEQRQSLMQKRAQIQTEIEQNAELLVGMAATELPIFLVRDLVSQIKLQAEDEHNDFIMQQALEQMDDYLSDFEMQYPESIEASRIFVDYVRKQTEADSSPKLYEMSDHALFQMNDLVENTLRQSVNNTKSLLANKADLKKQLDAVESYLTLDINEKDLTAIYDQIKAKEAELVEAQVEYNRLQQERSSINSTVITKSTEYSKDIEIFLQKLELHDDSERMMKYSNIALRILEAYAVELQRRKTGTLGATITKCYKQLANKKNLIQEIVMNSETLDMQYLDENGNEVSKESLSAGEKQLMVIAILWALALCSKKKLPVIIDTPLSRMDSQHRTSIISTYFPNASDQTIILSTDTEIDQNYYEMSTYLDYNASAPIDQRVLDVMIEVYKGTIGNADSRTHNHGESARLVVEKARKQVAELLGILPGEVFFTSGSTESNNIAIEKAGVNDI